MSIEQKVKDLTIAVNKINSDAKNINQLTELSGKIKSEDEIPIYIVLGNQTVKAKASDLAEYLSSNLSSRIADGLTTSADAWVIDNSMNIRAYATNYLIVDTYYDAAPVTLTLSPADVTYARMDAVVADKNGNITVLEGTPGAVVVPQDIDISQYFLIRYFLILDNATEPSDPTTSNNVTTFKTLYAENLGEGGGEANATSSDASINVDSTNAITGSKSIEATNVLNKYFQLAYTTNQTTSGSTHLNFRLRLKNGFPKSGSWSISFIKGNGVSKWFHFANGRYGYDADNLGVQNILIPLSETGFAESDFKTLRIMFLSIGSSPVTGYTIDDVKLLNGFNPPENQTGVYVPYDGALKDVNLGNFIVTSLLSNAQIDAKGNTVLPTAGWVLEKTESILGNPTTDDFVLSSKINGTRSWIKPSFVEVTESGSPGTRRFGFYTANKGIIGWSAIDLGYNDTGIDGGACGYYSFNNGYNNKVWGYSSFASGNYMDVEGNGAGGAGGRASAAAYHFATGIRNYVRGDCVQAIGRALSAVGNGLTVLGHANIERANSFVRDNQEDELLVIGNGTCDQNHNALVRSNAVQLFKDGTLLLPSVTNAKINAKGNKAVATKEYVDNLNLQKQVTASTYTILPTDNNYTIFFNSASVITVTVDNTLPDNFSCDFYNLGAGAVTFVAGTATLGTPDGTSLATDKVATLIKVLNNNNHKLKGELT